MMDRRLKLMKRRSPLFSCSGSYATWAYQDGHYQGDHVAAGWHLRWYRGVWGRVEAFRLCAKLGNNSIELSPFPSASPGRLRFDLPEGAWLEIAFADLDQLLIRGSGCEATLDGFVGDGYSAAIQTIVGPEPCSFICICCKLLLIGQGSIDPRVERAEFE